MKLAWSLAACVSIACAPDVGACDPDRAAAIAYERTTGLPAFEGQALVIASCGGGRFCHASGASVVRFGAPAGLDFDVRLAADDGAVDEAELARLTHARGRVVDEASLIYDAVSGGSMPPEDRRPAWTTDPVAAPWLTRHYLRHDGAALPGPRDADGREILRNWLACGAPVVERPVPRDDGVAAEVQPGRPAVAVEPTWDSIYQNVLVARGCADYSCHGGGDLDAGFEISEDAARSRTLLEVGAMASGEACRGEGRLVVAGDASSSLFYRKLAGDSELCGDRMPLGDFSLGDAELAAVAAWIDGLE